MDLVKEFIESEYSRLTEMAKIGHFGDYIIEIYSKEGPNPHFHFTNIHDSRIEGCIYLNKNKYFIHRHYTATLNSKERKLLVEFLNQKNDGISNYDDLCIRWNKNNTTQFSCEEMPDYLNLEIEE